MSQSWAEVESGIYGNPQLSNQARMVSEKEMRLYEVVTPGEDFYLGKQAGDTIGFRLVGRITGTATTALGEYQKVPMTKPPIYEATATANRYGIAVPWTGVREDLDRLDVEDTTIAALREHSARTHNALIYNALVAGRSFCYNAASSTTGTFQATTPAGASNSDYNMFHARKIKLNMTKNNIPFADGENYHAVISPTMYMGLFSDATAVTGFVDVKKYASGGADGILQGEVGKLLSTRYIEDNDALPDAIGTGTAYGSGFFCGYDACREVVVYPMRLLANMNLGGDFGQQKAIAWVSLLAYKTVWIHASHGQGAVVHYTST